ncbi:hypothetical protein [Psychrobacter sp. MES7-P7E]|uniref:hypothetical protein n=1 Tax=Psychrobacter sp. MES7-P7E TaxID=2058322 RepID=UPI000C7E8FBC|nr:hypothetical protein [Psychrobacter sp. MES7-P7E]PLT21122.1 hypothetical protein CXF62_11510 [Psychrobacter sp. MES7-P7E]
MKVEGHFADLNRHPKPVDPEWAATVAKYLEEVGATDLDDPSAPKRKTPRTDAQLKALAGIERKKADEKAQAEHQAALARLEDGTAVLRQKKDRTPILVTKPKAAKPAKKIARVVAVKKGPASHQLAKARRDVLIADLTAGKMVKMVSKSEKAQNNNEHKDYQKQRADLVYIKRNMDITLIRLNCLQTGESYFMIDNLTRHKRVKLSGNLIGPDREPLIKALSSGKLFEASNVTKGKKAGSASVANLAERHGMDIFSVISGRDLIGWVMPPNSDSTQ